MDKKLRRNIYIDKAVWEQLPSYINCSRSEFFEKQAIKQIYCSDDIKQLEKEIEYIKLKKKQLELDEQNLQDRIQALEKQKEINTKNRNIINDTMETIRAVNENEGQIDKKRIKFIANSHLIEFEYIYSLCERDGTLNIVEKPIKINPNKLNEI